MNNNLLISPDPANRELGMMVYRTQGMLEEKFLECAKWLVERIRELSSLFYNVLKKNTESIKLNLNDPLGYQKMRSEIQEEMKKAREKCNKYAAQLKADGIEFSNNEYLYQVGSAVFIISKKEHAPDILEFERALKSKQIEYENFEIRY